MPIYASQIAVCALLVHIALSTLAGRGFGSVPATTRWLLASAALLSIPLLWASDPAAGVVAYLNFAAGTIGGVAIAQIWKENSRGYSWIDGGLALFLILGSAQLLISFQDAGSLTALHQSSQTPWGNSNFVAGCLVVAAYVVMARSLQVGRYSIYAVALGGVTIAIALLTLSRGAILAAAMGAIFFLWMIADRRRKSAANSGPTKNQQGILLVWGSRFLTFFVPLVAFLAIERATDLRAQVNRQVFFNVDTRFTLYELAWKEFLQHPFTGTGWASFRDTSLSTAGQSQTFAHNLILSLLQIGGLVAVPYLLVLLLLVYRCLKFGGPYAAAVGAALTLSMTDPLFESTVGNLVILPTLLLGAALGREANQRAKELNVGSSGPTSARPHHRLRRTVGV